MWRRFKKWPYFWMNGPYEYACPVCGLGRETEEPRGIEPGTKMTYREWADLAQSFEICPRCGTEYGFDDFAETEGERAALHVMLRKKWIAGGRQWWSKEEEGE